MLYLGNPFNWSFYKKMIFTRKYFNFVADKMNRLQKTGFGTKTRFSFQNIHGYRLFFMKGFGTIMIK